MINISAYRVGGVTYVNFEGEHMQSQSPELYTLYLEYKADPTPDKENELIALLNPKVGMARSLGLELDGDNLFLPGTRCPVPTAVLPTLEEYAKHKWDVTPIVNFIKRLSLNPSEHCRKHLFTFIEKHGVLLTDEGYLVLYKAVREKDASEDDYTPDVAAQYIECIKAGIDPAKTYVSVDNGDVEFLYPGDYTPAQEASFSQDDAVVGTVAGIFHNIEKHIPEKRTMYTDIHSGTMDIGLRQLIRMPRSKVDPDTRNSCSYGLHVGTARYVQSFGGHNCPVFACLVDPSWIVAFPDHDDSKMRTEAYYTYAMMDRSQGNWKEIEGSFFEADLRAIEKKDLEDAAARIDEVDLESLSDVELEAVLARKKIVAQRLVELDTVEPDDSVNAAPVNAPHSFDTNDPTGQTIIDADDDELDWDSDEDEPHSLDDWDTSSFDDAVRPGQGTSRQVARLWYIDFLDDNEDCDFGFSTFVDLLSREYGVTVIA